VCHGQLAPPTPEQRRQATLERYAEQRASFGFRSDLPHVEELIRRDVWEYDVGYIPVTPAENRYLRLRDRLEASLKRLVRYPRNLGTVEVRYSERQLRRLANRIGRDRREHEAAGFDLSSWGPDIDSNTVRVELITSRGDHAEYFASRYGPVTTDVIATEPTIARCEDAQGYEISADGMRLTVGWSSSGDAKPGGVELREYDDRVEVGVVARLPSGGWTDDDVGYTSEVTLSGPLGDRAVIDLADGRRLRQKGPSPGEPPCPPEPPPGTMLDELVAARADMGLRNGRAFVRRLLRRDRRYTEAEQPFVAAWGAARVPPPARGLLRAPPR
jgi:hypothetical protein